MHFISKNFKSFVGEHPSQGFLVTSETQAEEVLNEWLFIGTQSKEQELQACSEETLFKDSDSFHVPRGSVQVNEDPSRMTMMSPEIHWDLHKWEKL